MKKDIEWLKKEVGIEMMRLEPHRVERWSDVKYQTLRSVAQKLDQLDEPEKVVVPQFVADEFDYNKNPYWEVDESKDVSHILKCAFGNEGKPSDFLDWVRENPEDYVMAVRNGYEVKEEPKYYVINNQNYFLLAKDKGHGFVFSTGGNSRLGGLKNSLVKFELTEQEIKDYDLRYWTFAVKVEEVE